MFWSSRNKMLIIWLLGIIFIYSTLINKLEPVAQVLESFRRNDKEGNPFNITDAQIALYHSTFKITKDGQEVRRNMAGKSYRLWENDDSSNPCVNFETRFAIDLNQVTLVSYPGSGNTWLRYLIEAASGIFTGSVMHDRALYRGGMLGELTDPKDGQTLTQKNHSIVAKEPTKKWEGFSVPTILLIRNPADALISHWNFKKTKNHIMNTYTAKFETADFHKFVMEKIRKWENLTFHTILGTTAPIHVIYYEQLKEDPLRQVSLLMDFMQVPVGEGRMDCIAQHLSGSFKRNSTKKTDPYTPEEKTMIMNAATRVDQFLKYLGFPAPPVYPSI